jgi:hypothetical protein
MRDAGALVSACLYKSSGEIRRFAIKRLVGAACWSVVRHSIWSQRNHRDRESECKEFGFVESRCKALLLHIFDRTLARLWRRQTLNITS